MELGIDDLLIIPALFILGTVFSTHRDPAAWPADYVDESDRLDCQVIPPYFARLSAPESQIDSPGGFVHAIAADVVLLPILCGSDTKSLPAQAALRRIGKHLDLGYRWAHVVRLDPHRNSVLAVRLQLD